MGVYIHSLSVTPSTIISKTAPITLSWTMNSIPSDFQSFQLWVRFSEDGQNWASFVRIPSVLSSSSVRTYSTTLSELQSTAGISDSSMLLDGYVNFRITYNNGYQNTDSTFSDNICYSIPPATAITAPDFDRFTTDTDYENAFSSSLTVKWGTVYAGTNNNIAGYTIEYATSTNNSSWGSWQNLTSKTGLNITALNYEILWDMSSKVSKGHYVKFRVKVTGSAGSAYDSQWVESSYAWRLPQTSPTSVSISEYNMANKQVTLAWSGATVASGFVIGDYWIYYATSSNGYDWSDWTGLNFAQSSPKTLDIPSSVKEGEYVKFAVSTSVYNGMYFYSTPVGSNSIQLLAFSKITAPTSFTLEANPLENKVNVTWSGASNGTNNEIDGVQIDYCYSSNNKVTWSAWTSIWDTPSGILATPSGTTYADHSALVSVCGEGSYVKMRIRMKGTAGASYYSSWVESNSIQLLTTSKITAPTFSDFAGDTGYSTAFKNSLTIKWRNAKAGTNNNITGYTLEYATSTNNSTWGSWTSLVSKSGLNTTALNYETLWDMSSKVSRGHYVKFRVRVTGSAGSAYYSDYVTSSSVLRYPQTAPTSVSISTDNSTSQNVTVSCSGATVSNGFAISEYQIKYATSSDGSNWSNWAVRGYPTSSSITYAMSSYVEEGHYVKFSVSTGVRHNSLVLYSDPKESSPIRLLTIGKITAPIFSDFTTDMGYSTAFNNNLTIAWNAQAGTNNNIAGYTIEYATSTNNSSWGSWTSLVSKSGLNTTSLKYEADWDMSSKVSRGHYVKFRVRVTGSAGSAYYSDYTISSSILRLPQTPPTLVTITPDDFTDNITVDWIGATIASGFTIGDYWLKYATSSDGVTWTDWTSWKVYPTSSPITYDMSSYVQEGHYVKFSVSTGVRHNGSWFYSPSTVSNVIKRSDASIVKLRRDNSWVDCKCYYGQNNKWVECNVYAGVSGEWKRC